MTIKEAYRFRDDSSDKFWRIEFEGTSLVVNYGKTGTTGKYQIKEFDSVEKCEKAAKKLIVSKVKKDYQPYLEFPLDEHYYFDDEEVGLHRLTSHPNFRSAFSHDLYYDSADEETPFGSGEGADALARLSEDLRKSKPFQFADYPKKLVERYMGLTYIPPEAATREAVEQLAEENKDNLTQSDMVTCATAFAQIKITGCVDAKLKAAAIKSLRRMILTAEVLGWNATGKRSEIAEQMLNDLEPFPAD